MTKLTNAEGNEQNYTADRKGNITGISDGIGTLLTAKYDKDGNAIETEDAAGNITYGELVSKTGNTENHYLYTGEYYDGTSGLYYLRARYMNPETGSFISMDSYQGSIYDPASLHRYTYANDNPVMYKDPSGYSAVSASVALGIQGALQNVVQINTLAILNGITSAFVSNLMGDSFEAQMKEFFKGYLCGLGLYGFAYFASAVFAISVIDILIADVAARGASSVVMTVALACDGDSSSVVKYEMQTAAYILAALMYRGSLPKGSLMPADSGINSINSLDDLLINPNKLSGVSADELYNYLVQKGCDVKLLNRGSFKVNWGGDRILQYHPANLSHHGGAYFKISSGETGTIRIDLDGNLIN